MGIESLEWELIFGDAGDRDTLPPKSARVCKFVYKPENRSQMSC